METDPQHCGRASREKPSPLRLRLGSVGPIQRQGLLMDQACTRTASSFLPQLLPTPGCPWVNHGRLTLFYLLGSHFPSPQCCEEEDGGTEVSENSSGEVEMLHPASRRPQKNNLTELGKFHLQVKESHCHHRHGNDLMRTCHGPFWHTSHTPRPI